MKGKWRKVGVGASHWRFWVTDGAMERAVGDVVLTGRPGVDNYPWDWYTEKAAGVADSLRSGKWKVEFGA